MRYLAWKAAFEGLARLAPSGLVRRFSGARGVIFTLHRVVPARPARFSPNAILQVTPDFLESAVTTARESGFDIVDMDEALYRLSTPRPQKPFVVFTFDDAYRDNLNFALPIMRKHTAPFTLYVPTALVDGVGHVWWQALEDIIANQPAIALENGQGAMHYTDTRTVKQKREVFDTLYTHLRKISEPQRIKTMVELAARYGFDLEAHCRDLIMDWSELKTFARDPLCTLGAHTVHHYELSKLPEHEARIEMEQSAIVLETQFGTQPRHFSYPIGSRVAAGLREYELARDLGFASAVTTRPGALYMENSASPFDLPRISLNGDFQKKRYLSVFLTGAYFSMLGGRKTFAAVSPIRPGHPANDGHGGKHPAHTCNGEIE